MGWRVWERPASGPPDYWPHFWAATPSDKEAAKELEDFFDTKEEAEAYVRYQQSFCQRLRRWLGKS